MGVIYTLLNPGSPKKRDVRAELKDNYYQATF